MKNSEKPLEGWDRKMMCPSDDNQKPLEGWDRKMMCPSNDSDKTILTTLNEEESSLNENQSLSSATHCLHLHNEKLTMYKRDITINEKVEELDMVWQLECKGLKKMLLDSSDNSVKFLNKDDHVICVWMKLDKKACKTKNELSLIISDNGSLILK